MSSNLEQLAEYLCGTLRFDECGPYIELQSTDATKDENYAELLSLSVEIRARLVGYTVAEFWADDTTQVIHLHLED